MVETTLVVASLATSVVGATYGFVGSRLAWQARAGTPSGRALLFFAIWWLATALNQIFGSTLYLAAAFGEVDLALHVSYVLVQRLLVALSLVALMEYLLYLHTGRSWMRALLPLYSVYYVSQVYVILSRGPIGVELFGWRTDLLYATAAPALWELTALVIVVPPIVGALALVRVYRRVEGRTRRFRIAMLSGGFVLWWTTAVVAGQPAMLDVAAFQGLNRIVGIVVALGILLAYEPVGWMRRRYELQPLSSIHG